MSRPHLQAHLRRAGGGHAQLYDTIRRVAERCRDRAHAAVPRGRRRRRFPEAAAIPLGRISRARLRYRRRVRTVRTLGRVSWRTAKVTGRAARHPLKTLRVVVYCVLLVVLLTPYTLGGAWHDARALGGRILPSAYDCAPTQREVGGAVRLASDLGHVVHHVATADPPTPQQVHDAVLDWSRRAGGLVGVFLNSADGSPTPTEAAAAAEQVATSCCTTTSTTAGAGDDPVDAAARALYREGMRGQALVELVATAGPESGYRPGARNPTSTARGEWMVMLSLHEALLEGRPWWDLQANAHAAAALWRQSGFRPWATTHGRGLHRPFMAAARQAVARVTGVQGPLPVLAAAAADPLVPPSQCPPGGALPAGGAAPANPAVEAAIAFARDQRFGEPYVWGAEGPDAWDCSGLVDQAYRLPGRPTTATLIAMGQPVEPGQERRGDLVFPDRGHVGIALGDGTFLEAPHTGDVVKVAPYGVPWQVRRLTSATPA